MVYEQNLNRTNSITYWLFVAAIVVIYGAAARVSAAAELDQQQIRSFINEMVTSHQFSDAELTDIFAQAKFAGRVVKAMSRPAEKAKPWHEYRKHFISQARINAGVKFWAEHHLALARAEERFGVAPEVIVGIIGVETSYGSFTGKDRVIDALTTLSFHYPENRSNRIARMKFFRSQLKDFFLLAREQSFEPLSLTGSYAGAMGIPQFMPESYRKYAIDFNQDERVDIWTEPVDAIGSVANYLAKNGGWIRGQKVVLVANIGAANAKELVSDKVALKRSVGELRRAGVQVFGVEDSELAALITLEGKQEREYWVALQNFRAIMKYNPRTKYAMAVYQLANEILQARKNQQ